MKELALGLALMLGSVSGLAIGASPALAQDMSNGADNFYKSDRVDVEKVTFKNKFGMKVVGNLFTPKDLDSERPDSGDRRRPPDGRREGAERQPLRDQAGRAGLCYAVVRSVLLGRERGPAAQHRRARHLCDDFSAAVDFLSTQPFVNKDNIGVLGICGSGSFAISAAQIDPRMKAIATVSMYDMGAANRDGLRKGVSRRTAQGNASKVAAQQRFAEFTRRRDRILTGGTVR